MKRTHWTKKQLDFGQSKAKAKGSNQKSHSGDTVLNFVWLFFLNVNASAHRFRSIFEGVKTGVRGANEPPFTSTAKEEEKKRRARKKERTEKKRKRGSEGGRLAGIVCEHLASSTESDCALPKIGRRHN